PDSFHVCCLDFHAPASNLFMFFCCLSSCPWSFMRSKFWRTEDHLAITLIFSSLHRFSIRFKLGLCLGLS
ncbi:hypothetical protein AMECASPLE_031060, partial [Ameca splendens]